MARPYVITHNIMSLDGRMRGFMPDASLFYDTAAVLDADCIMTGSDTILAAMEYEGIGPDRGEPPAPAELLLGDDRPMLAVVDTRGRINTWQALRNTGYWRELIALVSPSTPPQHIEYLDRWHVKHIMSGEAKVDMCTVLEALGRMGVKRLRTDSGGTINGVLLRQGYVDEVSVLLHPTIVGGPPQDSIFRDIILPPEEEPVSLRLVSSRRLHRGVVWLRYMVER
jgi:2,5-diamino-6-(ribosylamino)-4(3H)-pyrimidinone 5'-phosphate reductase